MSKLVVDASVAAKWFLPEEFEDEARAVATGQTERIAPPHIRAEVGNAILKAFRSGPLTENEARAAVGLIPDMPVEVRDDTGLLLMAFDLAVRYNRSIYDALYLALAVQEDCRMVTADRRFYNAMATELPRYLLWIEDLAADDSFEP